MMKKKVEFSDAFRITSTSWSFADTEYSVARLVHSIVLRSFVGTQVQCSKISLGGCFANNSDTKVFFIVFSQREETLLDRFLFRTKPLALQQSTFKMKSLSGTAQRCSILSWHQKGISHRVSHRWTSFDSPMLRVPWLCAMGAGAPTKGEGVESQGGCVDQKGRGN